MIKNSYDDYFGDEVSKWEFDELMEVVTKNNLEEQLSSYLESNGHNSLTLFSMPILDLGEKP